MWPSIVLSWFFPCRNFYADNFLIFFYESSCLLSYLPTSGCQKYKHTMYTNREKRTYTTMGSFRTCLVRLINNRSNVIHSCLHANKNKCYCFLLGRKNKPCKDWAPTEPRCQILIDFFLFNLLLNYVSCSF